MRRYTVTQSHMNVGVRGKCGYCPIAVSICEVLGIPVGPSQLDVRVMPYTLTIQGMRYRMPGNVRTWILGYDTSPIDLSDNSTKQIMAVGPFSFWLTPMDITL